MVEKRPPDRSQPPHRLLLKALLFGYLALFVTIVTFGMGLRWIGVTWEGATFGDEGFSWRDGIVFATTLVIWYAVVARTVAVGKRTLRQR
jgi:hypothetical protein